MAKATNLRREYECSTMSTNVRCYQLVFTELMTLVVPFHQICYRQFKSFHLNHVCQHLRSAFPKLPSYNCCVELLPRCNLALAALFKTFKGPCSRISIVDSTSIAICDNLRISRHRVFEGWQTLCRKGYLSKTLTQTLKKLGIEPVTKLRRNMKSITHSAFYQALLLRRSIVDTVFDELEKLCQIKHTRHRSLCSVSIQKRLDKIEIKLGNG